MKPLAALYDCILCDLDGVIYRGREGIPGAAETLAFLRELGVGRAFITNNASRTPEEVAHHLQDLGIQAEASEVVTSAQAGASLLVGLVEQNSKVYVVGGSGIDTALRDSGLIPVREPAGCAAVLQGFGPSVEWRHLAEAAYLIQGGAVWVATNSDLTFPTEFGIAPGNGSLVQAVSHAVGRNPDGIGGKPAPALISLAMARMSSREPLLVGDRYDTDIAGGRDLGIPTLLVLSGVTAINDVWRSDVRANYLGESIATLNEPYPQCVIENFLSRCNSSQAVFQPNAAQVVTSGGTVIDQLRAADALKWKLVSSLGIKQFAHGEISLEVNNNDVTTWGNL